MSRFLWVGPWVLVSVGACAVGPRYAAPHIEMPAAWPTGSQPSARGSSEALERWWTAFHDPQLDSLITRATRGNLDLRIATARIRESRAMRGIAEAAGLPQVDVFANYGRIQRSEAVPPFSDPAAGAAFGPREQNLFESGFDAAWEIDLFGGVERDKEAALAQVQATEESLRDVLVTVLADVARSYVELRAWQQQLAILERTVRTQEETLALVRSRFDAGLATDLDVARAEGLIATTVARRPVLNRATSEAAHRLAVLIGSQPGQLDAELSTPAPLPPAPPDLPAMLPSELLSRRPDLRRAERELAAATARVGVARADLFPRFTLVGSLGRRSAEAGELASFTSQFWSVIPGIRWPILSGGRIRANIRAESARQERAAHAYDKAILTALREVADALVAQERERERQASLRASIDADRRALGHSIERYTGGLENFLSVLGAQRTVFAAEEALVDSERGLALYMIGVYKALGGGWDLNGDQAQSRADRSTRP